MTENMFQEGLYQVYVKDTQPLTKVTNNEALHNVRIHRWFSTVVNTRLLVTGYVAAGCLAIEVQRKANKLKIITLLGLNLFSLLFGFSALLANSLRSEHLAALNTNQQRAGSYVAKGSSITFTAVCLLLSVYVIFMSWRGLRRYSSPYIQAYSRISQDPDDTNGPLLEQVEFSL